MRNYKFKLFNRFDKKSVIFYNYYSLVSFILGQKLTVRLRSSIENTAYRINPIKSLGVLHFTKEGII